MNTKIKISVAKDKSLADTIRDIDAKFARDRFSWCPLSVNGKTYLSDYGCKWEKEDVDMNTLYEYVKRGYAIKINC